MGALTWIVLVVLLSAGSCLSAVDVNWLTKVVKDLTNEYRVTGQFSLAAGIPLEGDVQQILKNNPYVKAKSNTDQKSGMYRGSNVQVESEPVLHVLARDQVYTSKDLIVAKALDRDIHAEYKVLSNLESLTNSENFLLLYSTLSPCSRCVMESMYNIVDLIESKVKQWHDSAFVFKTVYDSPRNLPVVPRKDLENILVELGRALGGLDKVYRCYKPRNGEFGCHSCSVQGRVSDICVNNDAVPGGSGKGNKHGDSRGQGSLQRSNSGSSLSDKKLRGGSSSSSGSSSSNLKTKKARYGDQSQSRSGRSSLR
uniref:RNA binding protein S1, serine-rich domain n=1 Tax=Nothobranchius kadleci TaxID=1051664 RepID=A0A1A8BKE2_NOTKA